MSLKPAVAFKLIKELKSLSSGHLEDISVSINEENIQEIHAYINGPVDTPYENGKFHVKLSLSSNFPNDTPKGTFLTKIFHPNVSTSGEICVSTLKRDWKPIYGIEHILVTIKCLLVVPNPESALNEEAGRLLLEDYDAYCSRAKLWTKVHAMSSSSSMAPLTDIQNRSSTKTTSSSSSGKSKSKKKKKKKSNRL